MNPKIRQVAVVGTGTLGTQIAIHSSFHGYQVATFDPDEKALQKTLAVIKARIQNSNKEPPISLVEIQR